MRQEQARKIGSDSTRKSRHWRILIATLALFSMFLGAGNMIFPPTLGRAVGDQFLPAFFSFVITAVGLVLMGVIATIRSGGTIESNARVFGPVVSQLFGAVILLCIGPGLALPRTAATTYEILHGSILPNLSPYVLSALFYGVVLFFLFHPKGVVSGLGKVLTPVLVVILGSIIIKSFFTPLGTPVATGMPNVLAKSFTEGYQTMDTLAGLAFSIVIIKDFQRQGITDTEEIAKDTGCAAVFAALGLGLVYGGMLYAGAQTSSLDLGNISRVDLILTIVRRQMGSLGTMLIGMATGLACLTTAIGLTSTFADFFERLTKGRVSYRVWCLIAVGISFVLSVSGVETIVAYSAPILEAVYPVAIVLIVLNTIRGALNHVAIYYGATLGAVVPALDKILGLLIGHPLLSGEHGWIPQAWQSFYWIVPAVFFAVAFYVVTKVYRVFFRDPIPAHEGMNGK